jgi:hypothetical protein
MKIKKQDIKKLNEALKNWIKLTESKKFTVSELKNAKVRKPRTIKKNVDEKYWNFLDWYEKKFGDFFSQYGKIIEVNGNYALGCSMKEDEFNPNGENDIIGDGKGNYFMLDDLSDEFLDDFEKESDIYARENLFRDLIKSKRMKMLNIKLIYK